MCRHLAYVGPPVRLGSLLVEPPHALVRQAWAPRRQTHGIMNVDGFGVGWYAAGTDVPARHRGAGPVWADPTFEDLCRVTESHAFLAAVRSATAGMVPGVAAAAPFRSGRWLFSHNGALPGYPASASALASSVPVERLMRLEAPTDSALLAVMTFERLDRGASPAAALADVANEASKISGARVNLLVTDGTTIAATALGASLSWRASHSSVVVASEPHDDEPHDGEPGWNDVPDGSVLTANRDGVEVAGLSGAVGGRAAD